MAYKFRKDLAILSGALDQEGPITIKDDGGLVTVQLGSPDSGLANGQLSGSGDLFVGDDLFTDGVADANVAATDQIFFKTGVHGAMKRDTAGDLRDLFFSVVSGDATVAAGGALTIANDAVEQAMIADDAVGADQLAADSVVEASIVDNAVSLAKLAGITRGSIIVGDSSGDPSLLAKGSAAQFLQSDGTDPSYVSISGDATIAGGALTISNNAVENAMMANDSVGADELIDASVGVAAISDAIAGDGLAGGSGAALSVQVSGAIRIASDKLGVTGSIAGVGLDFVGPEASIDNLFLDLNELSSTGIADGDSFAFIDATNSNATRKETVANLAALFAGAGLGAANSIISVANATDGGLAVNANDIGLDFNDLNGDAAVDVANDSIAFVDANDSNKTKKESIADLVSAIAGTGLTAAAGQLSVSAASGVNALASGGDADATLTESFNFASATITANRTYTLPASAGLQAGDTVHVKLAGVDPGVQVTVARAGSQTIDGVTSIVLESPGTAVSLKYVGSDKWLIF